MGNVTLSRITPVVILFLAFATSCPPPEADLGTARMEIKQAMLDYYEGMKAKSFSGVMKWFADEPDVILISPIAGEEMHGVDEIGEYMKKYFDDESFKFYNYTIRDQIVNVAPSCRVAWFSQIIDEEFELLGEIISVNNVRWTGVMKKSGEEWRFIQCHYSMAMANAQTVRADIEAVNAALSGAVQAGDAAAAAAFYTENAILMPPGGPRVFGRDSAQAAWTGLLNSGLKELTLSTVELMGSGNTICEIGEYASRFEPRGRRAYTEEGKYHVVWKRNSAGEWKIHIDIWNTNAPAR